MERQKLRRFPDAFADGNALKGKIIFWDIDGTLTAFRFDGSVRYPSMRGEKGLCAISGGMYYAKRPSAHMQRVVGECGAEKQLVLGRFLTKREIEDKIRWIHENFPEISGSIWVPEGDEKVPRLEEYAEKNGIRDWNRIVLIDDTHADLVKAEEAGFGAWHVSSFLDWGETEERL